MWAEGALGFFDGGAVSFGASALGHLAMPEAMRIAVVTTSWPEHEGDPAGHFVRAHARELEREGHEVVLVAPVPRNAFMWPGVGSAFGWPGVAARLRERPLRALDAVQWVARACVRLRGLQVDRVVAHWCVPCAWPIATLAAAPTNAHAGKAQAPAAPRLDVVSHGADVRLLAAMPSRAARGIVQAVAKRASSWTFPSQAVKLELFEALDPGTRAGVDRVAEVRAPPIEMPDVAVAIAARRSELGTTRVAVCVGRLVSSKRVDRVIEHIARERPADTLIVVGDGPERLRLECLARDRGIDARFVGKVDRREALTWIGAADAVIHASAAEGLSTVLREAAALGTPVVRLDLQVPWVP